MPRKNASELLKLAPGVMLSNEGGEGHAEQVFLRGFDAKEGQDIEFSVGGVPINESGNLHGNGYADTHFIIPELVSSLLHRDRRAVRPSPRQLRGGRQRQLRARAWLQRGFTAKYYGGQLRHRAHAACSGVQQGESKGTLAGAEIYKTDGYGQNRDAQRATVDGSIRGAAWARRARIASWPAPTPHTYHSAGVIREDDYEER